MRRKIKYDDVGILYHSFFEVLHTSLDSVFSYNSRMSKLTALQN